jgi:hypothetical protein
MKDFSLRVARCVPLFLVFVSPLYAQTPPSPFGADVFVGGATGPSHLQKLTPEELKKHTHVGWQIGTGLRTGLRTQWLQWTANYGSAGNEDVHLSEVLGGVRALSPWIEGGETAVRGFAHTLVGPSWARGPLGATRSMEFVAGGGFDVLLLRMQFDYVRTAHAEVHRNEYRMFVGGFLPLCFSGCRPEWKDGIPVLRSAAAPSR